MKRYNVLLSTGLLIIFLLVACGGGQKATPVVVAPQTGVASSTDASTLPIDLSGPPPGTPMIWVDGSILVHVPGGEFIMGGEGTDNPIHKVGLSSFWIYRTKVTNRMYAYCVAVGKCAPPKDQDSLKDFNDSTLHDIPVAGVDWEQADAYCKFIEGRLPTEAEWEKTARGPDGNVYPWGDAAPDCKLLNFNGDCVGKKTKVFDYSTGKSFYTALDMAGNAFEWAGDWYDPNYYGASPVADPIGPEAGTVRTVRSSSYQSDQTQVPSYRRFFLDPKTYRPDLGFRCVVENPHPFPPMCTQVLVPGKLGDEPVGGQPPDFSKCDKPTFNPGNAKCEDIKNQVGSVDGSVGNGKLIGIGGGSLSCSNTDSTFSCTGPSGQTVDVKVCVECKNPGNSPGGKCGFGEYFDGKSCVSQGKPGECPIGYTMDTVNQCCTAGPGIPVIGCGPGETLVKGVCVQGSQDQGSCSVFSLNVGNCPVIATQPPNTCPLTDAACKQTCPYGGTVNQDCNCNCNPPPATQPPCDPKVCG